MLLPRSPTLAKSVARFLPVAMLLAVGCGSAAGDDAQTSGASGGSGGSDAAGGAAGSAGDGAGGFGAGMTGGAGGAAGKADGCQNIDILFVIDDSGSMGSKQQQLTASFPGFVKAMKDKLAKVQSYHVGIVTSDDYFYNPAGCQGIGDLVTKTGGPASSNKTCGPWMGRSYMDGTDPDLAGAFTCVAKVGAGGSDDERMMRGLLNGVDASRKCNQGFLRNDSLLVIVAITDEDDVADGCDGSGTCMTYGSGGSPNEWYDEFQKKRGAAAQNTVMLSLLGKSGSNDTCGAVVNSKVFGFTKKFGDKGYTGDICSATYDQFFAEALPVINTACETFVPPK